MLSALRLVCASLILGVCLLAGPDDKETAPELQNSKPLTPKEEQKTFKVVKGFQVDLIASEPQVIDPVALSFDERGRCYVAETFRAMRGVTDNREHMYWLDDDLACRTVAFVPVVVH